jgi:hypothetical protein
MPPTTRAAANWAVLRVLARPELWAIVAEHSRVVAAFRLMSMCEAARLGVKECLRTLPGLVVCGGCNMGVSMSEVWRLDLEELQWERMPDLNLERHMHACCAVRGDIVVLGG